MYITCVFESIIKVINTYLCRTKFRTLEESPKKEKLADQIRETEQKLKGASEKYHTMNERLSVSTCVCVRVCVSLCVSIYMKFRNQETEQKLKGASEKYHTMNECLSVSACVCVCVFVCTCIHGDQKQEIAQKLKGASGKYYTVSTSTMT